MARFLGLGTGGDAVVNLDSYTRIGSSCSGTSGTTSLTATNASFAAGQRIFIHQSRGTGVGSYEDNTIASYSAGTITTVHPLENTYTDSGASQAQVVVVYEASAVTGSHTVAAWDGNEKGLFVIACSGEFSGTVNANEKGFRGGIGGRDSGDNVREVGWCGEETVGASSQGESSSTGGDGGAYNDNDLGDPGAGGGHANAGSNAPKIRGGTIWAGSAVGQEELTSIYFGGAGGGGGFGDNNPGSGYGDGGNSGGIIVVYTNKLDSTSSLVVNGENGEARGGDQGEGGGGSGGSILIKGIDIDVSGTITATSGTGPSNAGGGSVGRIRIESCSLSGSTSPSASESEGGHAYCGGTALIF